MTIIHELGHALKLSHTFSEGNFERYYTLGAFDANYELIGVFQPEVISCMNYSIPYSDFDPFKMSFEASSSVIWRRNLSLRII